MATSLIINGDDFGKNQNVNLAIAECFKRNYISSTTIMVNMPWVEEAAEIAFNEGFSNKVGLHLNLTEGVPLNSGIGKTKFTRDGIFFDVFDTYPIKRLFISKEEAREIEKEIKLQIEKYISLGFTNLHIDSHHHVHTNYSVYRVLRPLLWEHGIKSIRLSMNLNKNQHNPLKNIYKRLYNNTLKRQVEYTSDFFCGFDQFQQLNNDEVPSGVVEVMCHPDYEKCTNTLYNRGASEQVKYFSDIEQMIKKYEVKTY